MKDLKNIVPDEMLEMSHWVCHGTDKKPIDPKTLKYARPNDPTTWASYEEAKIVADKEELGLGFVFYQTDIIAIDIDKCYDKDTKIWNETCVDICNAMKGAYIEKSYSGTGVHILCKGTPQGVFKNSKLGVEMYDTTSPRYFTVTGDRLKSCDGLIDLTEAVSSIYQKYSNKQVVEEAMVKTINSQNYDQDEIVKFAQVDPLFIKLWKGELAGLPSQSDADFVLCKILAYWTNGNTEKIDELFRQSDAMRYKWDAMRGGSTYGSQTIRRAIARCDYYPPIVEGNDALQDEDLEELMKHIEPIEFIKDWEGFLPKGMLSMLFGSGGAGKSLIACNILAEATKRGEDVIWFPGEENLKKIIVARLVVAGADPKKVHILKKVKGEFLQFGNPKIEQYIDRHRPSIVIFDPVVKFFGDGDSNGATQVRKVLEPLQELAEVYDCCILIIHHCGKDRTRGAMGSVDFENAVRSSLIVDQGAVTINKSNISKSGVQKYFKIDTKPVGDNIVTPIAIIIDKPEEPVNEYCENGEWILEILKDGKTHMESEIMDTGRTKGVPFNKIITLKTGLRDKGLIRGSKQGDKYYWKLSYDDNPFNDREET